MVDERQTGDRTGMAYFITVSIMIRQTVDVNDIRAAVRKISI
jgi:hypothetical protein